MNQDVEHPVTKATLDQKPHFIRRIGLWFLPILLGLIATFITETTAGFFPVLELPVTERIQQFTCHLFQEPPAVSSADFLVLVAPLNDDTDKSQTHRLVSAFHGQNVNVMETCETVSFDKSKDLRTSEDEAKHKAAELIDTYHADLLVFGDAVLSNKSMQLWFMNGLSECDLHPTSVLLDQGIIPNKLNADISARLISTAVKEMVAGCNHDQSMNWGAFAERVKKVGNYLERDQTGSVSREQLRDISEAYSDALGLLYSYEGSLEWFTKSSRLFDKWINKTYANDSIERARAWYAYSALLKTKWSKTKKQLDFDAALNAIDRANYLVPNDVTYLSQRSSLLESNGSYSRALADLNYAIQLKPQLVQLYLDRAKVFRKMGKFRQSLSNLNKVIQLNPKDADVKVIAFNSRCIMQLALGSSDLAIVDCNEALKIRPKDAFVLDSRAFVYLKLGNYSAAIADFDNALAINAALASSYYGRSIARKYVNESSEAEKDLATAVKLQPTIASELASFHLIP